MHEGAILNDKELVCPWHSAKWNVETGELIWFPQKLKNQDTYQIVVEKNNIYVEILLYFILNFNQFYCVLLPI